MEYQIWNILKYSLYIGRIFYIMVFHNWYIARHVRSMQIQSRLGHAVLSNPRSGSGYGFAWLTYRSQYYPKQCHRLFDRLNRWLRQERFHIIPRVPRLGRVRDGWSGTIGPLLLSWDNCPEMVFRNEDASRESRFPKSIVYRAGQSSSFRKPSTELSKIKN